MDEQEKEQLRAKARRTQDRIKEMIEDENPYEAFLKRGVSAEVAWLSTLSSQRDMLKAFMKAYPKKRVPAETTMHVLAMTVIVEDMISALEPEEKVVTLEGEAADKMLAELLEAMRGRQ